MEEVVTKPERGRHRSSTEWREIITKYEGSGKSAKLFCREENLSTVTLLKWRNKFRVDGKLPSAKLEVGVVDDARSKFVEISGGASGVVESYAELSFPGGLTVRVRG